MTFMRKLKLGAILVAVLFVIGSFVYFRYFFTYEQKNIVKRKVDTITGQNLTVTVYAMNGEAIRTWTNIKKVTSSKPDSANLTYTFFYTSDGKYVQLPNSVWYIAEEK
jgi:hypothetical protein